MIAMVKAGVELAFETMTQTELLKNLLITNHFTEFAFDCKLY
jgi:hypothetical protein